MYRLTAALRSASTGRRQLHKATTYWQDKTLMQDALDGDNDVAKEMEKTGKAWSLTDIDQYREEMKPFLKELFIGKFQDIVLAYPEILSNDR